MFIEDLLAEVLHIIYAKINSMQLNRNTFTSVVSNYNKAMADKIAANGFQPANAEMTTQRFVDSELPIILLTTLGNICDEFVLKYLPILS